MFCTGNLVNTASAANPAGTTDPNPGNNSATDTDTPAPVADLGVTKTDNTGTFTPGGSTTYTIVVTNHGPSFVTGATVTDAFPAAITNANWTVTYTGTGRAGQRLGQYQCHRQPGGSRHRHLHRRGRHQFDGYRQPGEHR